MQAVAELLTSHVPLHDLNNLIILWTCTISILRPPHVLKTNCEPEDDLEQVETCRSIKYIEFNCGWTNTDLFALLNVYNLDEIIVDYNPK